MFNSDSKNRREIIQWNILSDTRNELFGLSVIGIIILHYFQDIEFYPQAPSLLRNLANVWNRLLGSTGVDIFLFLSGMGLYFSLKKSWDLKRFFQRRCKRLLLPYFVFGTIYWIVLDLLIIKTDIGLFLSDLFTISFWTRGEPHFWYVSFLLICYALYPLIFKIIDDNSRKHRFRKEIVLAIISCVIVGFISVFFPDWYEMVEISLCRILVFLLGCYAGKAVFDKETVHSIGLIIGGIILRIIWLGIKAVGINLSIFSNQYPLNRWVISWSAIGIMVILAFIIQRIKSPNTCRFLSKTGEYSLELYLTHVSVRKIFHILGVETYNPLVYVGVILVSIMLSIGLRKITDIISVYQI
ncbi:MAG: acyltransferase [Clostridiales bacterium]|nr:acyltransferase [Clostridiales bacterium]